MCYLVYSDTVSIISPSVSGDSFINLSIYRANLVPCFPPVFSENETTVPEFNVCDVTLTQTEGKRSSGSGASAETEPRPSEERGRHLGPQRQAGRLQEADPAGPEGGKQVSMPDCSSSMLANGHGPQ